MSKQERPMRQMDRDLLGAVVVINNDIVSGKREDTAGPLAVDLLRKFRVYASEPIPDGTPDESTPAGGVSEESLEQLARDAAPADRSSSAESAGAIPGDSRLYHCRETLGDVGAALETAIDAGARVIVTVGGTGISQGDVAPEATAPLLEVRMEGIAQQIREHGLTVTPLASLSRGLVGITHRGPGGVLIVNAPGSRGGVKDSLAVVCPLFPHIFEQLDDQGV